MNEKKETTDKQTDKPGIKLPRDDSDQEQAGAEPKENPSTERRKARILLVDDDDTLVQLNQQRLSRLGYDVVATTSSKDALEIFQKDPDTFDLVLTDYAMPNLTGMDLAAGLLKAKPTIPIILCTGYVGAISLEYVRDAGIKALLLKPLGKHEMVEAIGRVLDANLYRSAAHTLEPQKS
jgi:two-component system, cell cycle sensor histidine kinase and response regulator CckA